MNPVPKDDKKVDSILLLEDDDTPGVAVVSLKFAFAFCDFALTPDSPSSELSTSSSSDDSAAASSSDP